MKIVRGESRHLELLAPLFDGYRQFYGCRADLPLATRFLKARLASGDSILFLATSKDSACGFTQLYPSFSSVAAQKLLILNDLYVKPEFRQQGTGRALMQAARQYSRERGYRGLNLETQESNVIGQKLYESLGYQRQRGFFQYFLATS